MKLVNYAQWREGDEEEKISVAAADRGMLAGARICRVGKPIDTDSGGASDSRNYPDRAL